MSVNHKSTVNVYVKCLFICTGSIFFGYQLGVLNMANATLNAVFNIKPNGTVSALLNALIPIGATVGTAISTEGLSHMSRI